MHAVKTKEATHFGFTLATATRLNHTTNMVGAADYGYNAGHQRITFTNAAGTSWTNSYDRIGQLKITDSSVNSEDRGYTYDDAWNLNYRTNNGTTSYFNVNSRNELTTTSLGSATYDGNGNLTSSHSGARSYVYDDENRLVELYVGQNENATEFVYDGLGRLRIRREYTYDSGGGGDDSLSAPGGLSAVTSQSLGGGQSRCASTATGHDLRARRGRAKNFRDQRQWGAHPLHEQPCGAADVRARAARCARPEDPADRGAVSVMLVSRTQPSPSPALLAQHRRTEVRAPEPRACA